MFMTVVGVTSVVMVVIGLVALVYTLSLLVRNR